MRSRVAGATRGLPAKVSDAVDGETPARAATAARVGRPVGGRPGATGCGTSRPYRVERRAERAYRGRSNRFDDEGCVVTDLQVSPRIRHARTAVVVAFLINGLCFASWISR